MRALVTSALLVLMLQSTAAAYTLVMRGGRRVEIAEAFSLSGAQLTYEAAPGVSVTLPLDMVDVAATERANNEPSGSFLRRAAANDDARQNARAPGAQRDGSASGARTSPTATPRAPVRTLTNRELEPVRRARIESERAYERRRVELGLPSAEEARERDREEERAMSERARQKDVQDEDAEGYWRERAADLREEAGALDAEISHLRGLLAATSNDSSVGFSSSPGLAASALTVNGGPRLPFGRGNFGRGGLSGNFPVAPFAARNPANAALLSFGGRRSFRAGININGGTRAGVGRRSGFGKVARPLPRGRFARRHSSLFAPGLVGVVAPFDYASADAFALVTRLRLLEGERAGVAARWRLLQDEARRAGALPGWLRP